MKNQNPMFINEYIEIPKIFYSDASGKPISHCIDCNKYLLDDGTLYVIEKAMKQYQKFSSKDTILEYAICLNCYERMRKTFSKISLQRIDNYFNKHVNLMERRKRLLSNKSLNLEDWISSCIIKGKRIEELAEYQIACQCDGKYMLFTFAPFVIGEAAIEEIMNLLSNQTLGEIEGFMKQFFSYPPEIADILTGGPVFVL
jgi:hypothetical protein